MGFVERFSPHLPFVRRYARALTGSQESGDAYVKAALTALANAPEAIDSALPDRIALYRFCHVIWDGTGARLEESGADEIHDARLQALAPRQRQAFLLTAMEGFSHTEAAQVLDTNVAEIDALIAKALEEIEADLATSVLIIEDEPIIAADLEAIVGELGHAVTGNAATHKDAVKLARKAPPGLILCDIQLADGSSGVEAAEEILAEQQVPIVFITAFPEALLTGERKEPVYLVTKPFQPDSVKAAIAQALFFHD
ncbi:MAG: response regulator [Pseudomonadota bacterium]